MKYIAHRGFSKIYEENTIPAFREALERKYDGLEIDVQLCKTGELVLFHDICTEHAFIKDLTFEELKRYGVCSLREVYDEIPEIRFTCIIVDIKGNDVRIAEALRVFYESESTENVIFCSFNRKILRALPNYFIKGSTFETTFTQDEYDGIMNGMSGTVIHWTCLDHDFISYCKSRNIRVYTYTHKGDRELEHMLKYDIDGVITNGL